MLIDQPPYAGLRTFVGVPYRALHEYASQSYTVKGEPTHVVISGVCIDALTTNRSGAREAPAKIRDASMMLCELDSQRAVIDIGDIVPNGPDEITRHIKNIVAKDDYPVTFGGDHSITLHILKAMAEHYGRPISLVHFDAHPDTWPSNWGVKKGHGSFLYEALEAGYVDGKRSAMIGVRSSMDDDVRRYTHEKIGIVIPAVNVHRGSVYILSMAADLAGYIHAGTPTYLTFDIDAIDPAFAPGTGTPEIGGLATWQVMEFIRSPYFQRDIRWVGMDVVEVLPAYDHAQITALAAAQIAAAHIEGLPKVG